MLNQKTLRGSTRCDHQHLPRSEHRIVGPVLPGRIGTKVVPVGRAQTPWSVPEPKHTLPVLLHRHTSLVGKPSAVVNRQWQFGSRAVPVSTAPSGRLTRKPADKLFRNIDPWRPQALVQITDPRGVTSRLEIRPQTMIRSGSGKPDHRSPALGSWVCPSGQLAACRLSIIAIRR